MTRSTWIALTCGLVLGLLARPWLSNRTTESGEPAPGPRVEVSPFDALVPEKRQFVANTYQLAFDLYKSGKFTQCLYEIAKLHQVLPSGYRDSRDIETYARKGAEVEQQKNAERAAAEERERSRKELNELVDRAEAELMAEHYGEVSSLVTKVIEMDPDNAWAERMTARLKARQAAQLKRPRAGGAAKKH